MHFSEVTSAWSTSRQVLRVDREMSTERRARCCWRVEKYWGVSRKQARSNLDGEEEPGFDIEGVSEKSWNFSGLHQLTGQWCSASAHSASALRASTQFQHSIPVLDASTRYQGYPCRTRQFHGDLFRSTKRFLLLIRFPNRSSGIDNVGIISLQRNGF